jgi:hypothetical protein
MADSPAPLGVAVDLTDTRVNPDADCTDEGRFTKVGTESRPEVVVQVRPSMEGSSVKRQPMSQGIEEPNNQGDSHHEKDDE